MNQWESNSIVKTCCRSTCVLSYLKQSYLLIFIIFSLCFILFFFLLLFNYLLKFHFLSYIFIYFFRINSLNFKLRLWIILIILIVLIFISHARCHHQLLICLWFLYLIIIYNLIIRSNREILSNIYWFQKLSTRIRLAFFVFLEVL